jgi:hypothetical protein
MRWADLCRTRPACQPITYIRSYAAETYLQNTAPAQPLGNLPPVLPSSTRNVPCKHLDEVQPALPALQAALVRARNQVRLAINVQLLLVLCRALICACLRKLEARVEQVATEDRGATERVRDGGVGEVVGEELDLPGC